MGPLSAAAEIGGGPNPRLPQVAAARRESRRAACEVSGGVTAAGSAPPGPPPFGPVPRGVPAFLATKPV